MPIDALSFDKIDGFILDVVVVIPVLNAEKYIASCMKNIDELDYPRDKFLVVVVDNGSTDNTLKILSGYDVKIMVAPNVNVSKLRNIGAYSVKSKMIAFVDADCCVDRSWLKHGVKKLMSDHTIGVLGAYYSPPPASTWVEKTWHELKKDVSGDVSFLSAGNMLLRSDVFWEAGGFAEEVISGEDYELCQRLRFMGYRVNCDPLMKTIHLGNAKKLVDIIKKERWYGVGMFDTIKHGEMSKPLLLVLIVIFLTGLLVAGLLFSTTISLISALLLLSVVVFVSFYFARNVKPLTWSIILKCFPISLCYLLGRILSVYDILKNRFYVKKEC